VIGEIVKNRESYLHNITEEETRLAREQADLEERLRRIVDLDGRTAEILLDAPAVVSNIIGPIREEIEALERKILDGQGVAPVQREAYVIARKTLQEILDTLTFKQKQRESYFAKIWKEFKEHASRW
jgi:hypothetical protein